MEPIKENTELQVYTISQVQSILGLTQKCVYNYIQRGNLKAAKFGNRWRVSRKDLEDFIERGTKAH